MYARDVLFRTLRPRSVSRMEIDPLGAQRQTLKWLLRRARRTSIGVKYNFGSVADSDELFDSFREAVPLHTYQDLLPWLERIWDGDKNVLWPGITNRFAVSSGTVSSGKLIPATEDMLRRIRRCGVDALRCYISSSGNYQILGGKLIAVSGAVNAGQSNPAVTVGEMSGLVRNAAPAWISNYWQTGDNSTTTIPRWDAKLTAIARDGVNADVRAIAMVPSWSEPLFEEVIRLAIENGHGARNGKSLSAIWPNLSVLFSSGVPLSSYIDTLNRYTGTLDIDFIELYTASEGFFAFQDAPGQTDMLLRADSGVFYEFVRLDELESENPHRYTVDEVEKGVKYALFVSTCAGLWCYGMRDVIEFTSLYPHRLLVTGRTAEMLDKYGEAVYADEVRLALEVASAAHGAAVWYCHVAPAVTDGTTPRHAWLIEFGCKPDSVERFRDTLDNVLRDSNRHYQIRREANAIGQPEIVCVPEGTFASWLRTRPCASAQMKMLLVSDQRKTADELAAIAMSRQS